MGLNLIRVSDQTTQQTLTSSIRRQTTPGWQGFQAESIYPKYTKQILTGLSLVRVSDQTTHVLYTWTHTRYHSEPNAKLHCACLAAPSMNIHARDSSEHSYVH